MSASTVRVTVLVVVLSVAALVVSTSAGVELVEVVEVVELVGVVPVIAVVTELTAEAIEG